MRDHGLEALVADGLPVDGAHVLLFVSHDMVGCRLVLHFVGDGAERVTQAIEIPVAVDAERVQDLPHFLGDGTIGHVLGPAVTVLRDTLSRGFSHAERDGSS